MNTITMSVFVSSDPPFREENASVGEVVGELVGDHVATSITTVLEGSTTGTPNITDVDVVIVVEPSAMDSSIQRVAVAGSEKAIAT